MPNKERIDRMRVRATVFNRIIKSAGPNFDYGDGAYTAMSEGKKMKDITDAPHKSPGAFFADDGDFDFYHGGYADLAAAVKKEPREAKFMADDGDENDLGTGFYENLEHYKSVRDFIQHTPLGRDHGAKIKPEWERAKDVNHIDFPVDEDINHDTRIYPEEGQYQIRRMKADKYVFPSEGEPLGPENTNISLTTPQIAGEHTYLPDPDFSGKMDNGSQLDFGRDYDDEATPVGRTWDEAAALDDLLDKMEAKYLEEDNNDTDMPFTAAETEIYGLPDGVQPDAKDADQTIQNLNPWDTKSDISREMYDDKWNI